MPKIKNWAVAQQNTRRTVWVNPNNGLRVYVEKGQDMWVASFEKNVGSLGSEAAWLPDPYIAVKPTRAEAEKKAVDWMRRNL